MAVQLAEAWLKDSSELDMPVARRTFANALRAIGKYDQAASEFRNCKLGFQANGEDYENFRTNNYFVMALRYLGKYAEAIDLALESITFFTDHPNDLESGRQYLNLATLYRRVGRLSDALQANMEAMERFLRIDNQQGLGILHINTGNLLMDMGEFDQALGHHETAAQIFRRLNQSGDLALALINLGRLRALRGEFGESIAILQECGRQYSRLKRWSDRAFVDLYLLQAYVALNLDKEARQACRKAIAAFDDLKMPYELGQALLIGADLQLEHRRPSVALRQARRAIEVFASTGNQLWLQIGRARAAQIALALRNKPDVAALLKDVLSARAELESLGAQEWVGRLKLTEAELHQRSRRPDAEKAALVDALAIGMAIRSTPIQLSAHWKLGVLEEMPTDDALEHLNAAAECVERLRLHSRSANLKAAFLGNKTPLYDSAIDLLLTHRSLDVSQTFDFIERSRSRSLADSTGETSCGFTSSPEELKLRCRLSELRARSQTLYDRAYGTGDKSAGLADADPSTELDRLEKSMDRLRQELFLLRPSAEHAPRARLHDLQATLSHGQVALVYFEARQHLHAMVVTATGSSIMADLAPTRIIERHARRIKFHVGKAAYGSDYMRARIEVLRDGLNDPLRALGDLVISPLLHAIGNAHEVIIFPSTVSYGLPFHAFVLESGDYAIDHFAIQYQPSATVRMVNAARNETPTGPVLVVAVTDETLPGVKDEVEIIGSMLPNATVLTDHRATVEEFRGRAAQASAVHLATHGVFREDNPAYSGIKLADGWITAADLAEVCRDASLITLSACETGMGADMGGGEIMGISQAILGAGCSSLVSSLWTADDRATVPLMADFYTHLAAGLTAPYAMREAMLAARQRDDHPYFWAPFAVFGEGRLPTSPGTSALTTPRASAAPDPRRED